MRSFFRGFSVPVVTGLVLCGIVAYALYPIQAAPTKGDPEAAEPALGFTLQIGDKTVRVREGEATKIDGRFNNPEVRLVADEFRIFSYAGINFRYPRGYAYEADFTDKDVRMWTLTGNACTVMVYSYAQVVTPEEFASNLADTLDADTTKVSNGTMKVGSRDLKGKRIQTVIAGNPIVYDAVAVPSAKGSVLLVLQDSVGKDGMPSRDRRIMAELIDKTFATAGKK